MFDHQEYNNIQKLICLGHGQPTLTNFGGAVVVMIVWWMDLQLPVQSDQCLSLLKLGVRILLKNIGKLNDFWEQETQQPKQHGQN
jgi:hypothetical protein